MFKYILWKYVNRYSGLCVYPIVYLALPMNILLLLQKCSTRIWKDYANWVHHGIRWYMYMTFTYNNATETEWFAFTFVRYSRITLRYTYCSELSALGAWLRIMIQLTWISVSHTSWCNIFTAFTHILGNLHIVTLT